MADTVTVTVTHTNSSFTGTITVQDNIVLPFTNGTATVTVPSSALGVIGTLGFQVTFGAPGPAPAYDANLDTIISPIVGNAASQTAGTLRAAFDTPEASLARNPPPAGTRLSKLGVVLSPGTGGAWDNTKVESMAVIFCPENGRWAGFYTGYGNSTGQEIGGIGLAWSDDGVTWTKAGQILSASGVNGDPDKVGLTAPVPVYDENGLLHLFYLGLTLPGYEQGISGVCHATTPSLLSPTWTRTGLVMAGGGSGWRSQGVWHPNFIKVGGTWHCFINATGVTTGDATLRERVGHATASSLAGPWTFDDAHSPLLADSSPASSWIVQHGDPFVTRVPGGFRMDLYRAAFGGGGTDNAEDYFAVTTEAEFPYGWRLGNGGAATLTAGPGAYDGKFAHKPWITRIGGRLFHYYTAVDKNDVRQAAVAIDPPLVAAGPFAPAVPGSVGLTDELLLGVLDALASLGVIADGSRLFADDFPGANGAALSGSWTIRSGGWAVDSGTARPSALDGNNMALATVAPGSAWRTVSAVIALSLPGAFTGLSLITRYVDTSNYLYLEVKPGGDIELVRVQAGNPTLLASATGAVAVGNRITLKQDPTTGAMSVRINGVEKLTATDTFQLSTQTVGIRAGGGVSSGWDNFIVRK